MYLCGSNQSRKETLENKRYNNVEEWANTLSHGAGILLGVIAGYFLLAKAAAGAEPKWAVACVTVYLFGMLSSYVSSTWYHGSRPGKLKELLRKFDHTARHEARRRLGMGNFLFCLAVGYRRFYTEFQETERTQ